MLPVPFALLLTAIATASPHLSNISTPTGSTARYITHAVAITDTRLARRNNGIIRQGKIKNPNTDEWIDAPFELKALVMTNDPSTGRINPDLNEFDYVYRSEAGSGTWVYLVESGIDEDHPEFKDGCTIVPRNKWVNFKRALPKDPHGTAVASKICGKIAGVAKKTTIIPAIEPFLREGDSIAKFYKDILEDIDLRRNKNDGTVLAGKTVINLSIDFKRPVDKEIKQEEKTILKKIMDRGVVIVAAAGNSRLAYPGKWARDGFPLLGVYSVDRKFHLASEMGRYWTISAVGKENIVADVNNESGYGLDSGVSYATGLISGLIVYLLSLPESPIDTSDVKQIAENVRQGFLNRKIGMTFQQSVRNALRKENEGFVYPFVAANGLDGRREATASLTRDEDLPLPTSSSNTRSDRSQTSSPPNNGKDNARVRNSQGRH